MPWNWLHVQYHNRFSFGCQNSHRNTFQLLWWRAQAQDPWRVLAQTVWKNNLVSALGSLDCSLWYAAPYIFYFVIECSECWITETRFWVFNRRDLLDPVQQGLQDVEHCLYILLQIIRWYAMRSSGYVCFQLTFDTCTSESILQFLMASFSRSMYPMYWL